MSYRYFSKAIVATMISLTFSGCQSTDLSFLKKKSLEFIQRDQAGLTEAGEAEISKSKHSVRPLSEIISGSLVDQNVGTDFKSVVISALNKDPVLTGQRRTVEAKLAAVDFSESKKKYRINSTIYGGIEDITDNTKGLALSLNASRLIFDGGLVDAEIAAKGYQAEAAELNMQATLEERAHRLAKIWVELEQYESLQKQIDERLAILEPLIVQLEQVAKAGIGDVSKVTAAQRTVSGIRVTQTNISEGLATAQLEYLNAYGKVQKNVKYNEKFVRNLIPDAINDDLAQQSPLLLAKYAEYNAALARLAAVRAKDEFNVGFEARAMRPFAGSGYDSDESIGLVARKTLFNGGMLESEIQEAEAMAEASMSAVEATYRQGMNIVNSAKQSVKSMDKAINLAKDNAQVTADEIVYLRQQLIIGGSTLDSVLSAEARLYEAESKEIRFVAQKRKAELLIASTLGFLGPGLGF